jgi:hypothetical protein
MADGIAGASNPCGRYFGETQTLDEQPIRKEKDRACQDARIERRIPNTL